MKNSTRGPNGSVSIRRRFLSVPTLLSFIVAAGVLLFLATRLELDWSATGNTVRGMNPWLYALAFVSFYLSFGFRAARWRLLASNAGVHASPGTRLPSTIRCAQLLIIGWFVNTIAWLRLGDAYRAYAFSEDSGGGFSWSLGTILAERVLDMAVIFAVLLVSAIFLSTARDTAASNYIVGAASAMAFALVALLLLMKRFGATAARFLPGRLEAAYHHFQEGTLGSFKEVHILIVLSLLGWAMEIARLYFVIRALGLDVELALVPVAALGNAILSTVPTPGGVGAVEPGVTGLLLLSMERSDAVSTVLVDRSITYVSVLLIGGLVFFLRQLVKARIHSHTFEAPGPSA